MTNRNAINSVTDRMSTRTELVARLVREPLPDPSVLQELAAFGWDSEEELVTVTKEDVRAILARLRSGELHPDQVQRWANRIEGREDVGYEGDGVVNEAIFWLANPYLNWPIDSALCARIESMFRMGAYLRSGL